MADVSEIQDFYNGCSVFVTGGTGFLGKLVVEKLLRSCPGVRKLYLLIRPKRGASIEERKKSLLEDVMLERLKLERPEALEKLVFVPGDSSCPRLGISDLLYQNITQHVNVVMHLAATVRFDEKMKMAINVNVRGAMEVLSLCRDCHNLRAAVFVSTAFTNTVEKYTKEKFYDPPMEVEEILHLMDRVTEPELEILSHKITGYLKIPYLFSKSLVENMLLKHATDLPVAIVRPSMVVSTAKEPLRGWLDNMYGPISIVTGVGTGVLRVNYAPIDLILDIVPADYVTNCIIAVSVAAATRSKEDVSIYNIGTSEVAPLTIRVMRDTFIEFGSIYPAKKVIWYPFMLSVANFKLYKLVAFILHVFPGCLIDLALRLKGQTPMLLKIYRKICKYATITSLFPNKDLVIVCKNTLNLYDKLGARDKELFFFDVRELNWRELIAMSTIETRKYLLNETLDNIEEARSLNRKLYLAHTTVKVILYGLALWTLWNVAAMFLLAW